MITINADRPALEITRSGIITRWEYDVVTIKLEIERLEDVHKLKDGQGVKAPTSAFLNDFAASLSSQGLTECTPDLAVRIYSLVSVQFAQMAKSLTQQLAELMR